MREASHKWERSFDCAQDDNLVVLSDLGDHLTALRDFPFENGPVNFDA